MTGGNTPKTLTYTPSDGNTLCHGGTPVEVCGGIFLPAAEARNSRGEDLIRWRNGVCFVVVATSSVVARKRVQKV